MYQNGVMVRGDEGIDVDEGRSRKKKGLTVFGNAVFTLLKTKVEVQVKKTPRRSSKDSLHSVHFRFGCL